MPHLPLQRLLRLDHPQKSLFLAANQRVFTASFGELEIAVSPDGQNIVIGKNVGVWVASNDGGQTFPLGAQLLPSPVVIPRSPMVKAGASITQESETVANPLIWLGRSVTPVLVWPAQLIMEQASRLQAMLLSARILIQPE